MPRISVKFDDGYLSRREAIELAMKLLGSGQRWRTYTLVMRIKPREYKEIPDFPNVRFVRYAKEDIVAECNAIAAFVSAHNKDY